MAVTFFFSFVWGDHISVAFRGPSPFLFGVLIFGFGIGAGVAEQHRLDFVRLFGLAGRARVGAESLGSVLHFLPDACVCDVRRAETRGEEGLSVVQQGGRVR